MTTTTVRTDAIELPGGQVLRVSRFVHEAGTETLVVSKGWPDGASVAGLDCESAVTIPGSVRVELATALQGLGEDE